MGGFGLTVGQHFPSDHIHRGAARVPVQGEHCTESLQCQLSASALRTLTSPNLNFLIHDVGVDTEQFSQGHWDSPVIM